VPVTLPNASSLSMSRQEAIACISAAAFSALPEGVPACLLQQQIASLLSQRLLAAAADADGLRTNHPVGASACTSEIVLQLQWPLLGGMQDNRECTPVVEGLEEEPERMEEGTPAGKKKPKRTRPDPVIPPGAPGATDKERAELIMGGVRFLPILAEKRYGDPAETSVYLRSEALLWVRQALSIPEVQASIKDSEEPKKGLFWTREPKMLSIGEAVLQRQLWPHLHPIRAGREHTYRRMGLDPRIVEVVIAIMRSTKPEPEDLTRFVSVDSPLQPVELEFLQMSVSAPKSPWVERSREGPANNKPVWKTVAAKSVKAPPTPPAAGRAGTEPVDARKDRLNRAVQEIAATIASNSESALARYIAEGLSPTLYPSKEQATDPETQAELLAGSFVYRMQGSLPGLLQQGGITDSGMHIIPAGPVLFLHPDTMFSIWFLIDDVLFTPEAPRLSSTDRKKAILSCLARAACPDHIWGWHFRNLSHDAKNFYSRYLNLDPTHGAYKELTPVAVRVNNLAALMAQQAMGSMFLALENTLVLQLRFQDPDPQQLMTLAKELEGNPAGTLLIEGAGLFPAAFCPLMPNARFPASAQIDAMRVNLSLALGIQTLQMVGSASKPLGVILKCDLLHVRDMWAHLGTEEGKKALRQYTGTHLAFGLLVPPETFKYLNWERVIQEITLLMPVHLPLSCWHGPLTLLASAQGQLEVGLDKVRQQGAGVGKATPKEREVEGESDAPTAPDAVMVEDPLPPLPPPPPSLISARLASARPPAPAKGRFDPMTASTLNNLHAELEYGQRNLDQARGVAAALQQENDLLRQQLAQQTTGRGLGLSVSEGMIALQPMWMPVGPSLMQAMGWNGSAVVTAASGLRSDRNKAPRGGAPPANWWSNAQRGAYVEGSEQTRTTQSKMKKVYIE